MKGLKPWLLVALVFLAGLAVGALGTRRYIKTHPENLVPRDAQTARERVEHVRDRMEKDLISKLDLTPEQQTNVHAIFAESGEQLRKLHSDFEPRMKGIFDTAHERIAAILTPEQKLKFEQITKERREHYEKFRDKGFGPPRRGERPPSDSEKR